MTTSLIPAPRITWKLTSPSALFAWALAAFMLFLSVRGLLDPVAAADGFGLPIHSVDARPWLRIKADRDLDLGLIFLALILTRSRRSFGWAALLSTVCPVIDALTVISLGVRSVAYALAVHGTAVVYGLALGAWILCKNVAAATPSEAGSF